MWLHPPYSHSYMTTLHTSFLTPRAEQCQRDMSRMSLGVTRHDSGCHARSAELWEMCDMKLRVANFTTYGLFQFFHKCVYLIGVYFVILIIIKNFYNFLFFIYLNITQITKN